MKKTIAIVILAAFVLATFPSIVSAWNPPGMFVREDDRLEDTPWGEADSYTEPSDYDEYESISEDCSSDIVINVVIIDLGIFGIFNDIIIDSKTQSALEP